MDTFVKIIDEKLSAPMTKLANQRHLRAVRDGIVATLPLIIVGSFFLIIGNPPLPENWGITIFLKANAPAIVLPYRLTMAIMTLYATFGIGHSLAESYDLDGLSGGILATAAFLLTFTPINIPATTALAEAGMLTAQGVETLNLGVAGWVLPMANLGGGGMFVGIITAILAVEIFRFTDKSGFKISMPPQVPASVSRSFEALVPTAIILLLMATITYWLGFNWHSFIGNLVKPLLSATDSLPSVIIQVLLVTIFWAFGIHGVSIIGSIARPIWLQLLDANSLAFEAGVAGTALPHIGAEPFFQWFIWIGGSGATIGLAIAMAFFAKSAYAKSLGKTAFIPAVFNINEPIIFGAPIVLNPILIIPFILTPTVLAIIAWIVTSMGLVNRVVVTAPWTLPGPIGAYLATGGDWRAAVLSIVLIIIAFLIYFPFFKIYDNKLVLEENADI
ncbi:PTS sugar transporter subunit IIC [Erysipelothrix sp. HDW6C]|uniref:PTS sugar transporter subunit IIC n=1 Tax=Erysipelothrix sp. HDW6C TaxID=2714930 RepID=UPI00140D52AA|nr:PTS sugar transporter subunit IIC [Erysipelothrix sp. HDW6C]QIK69816.1 PTS sugar transporter subunit IIC [Erysipelothrix sp. HDW6C]